MRDPAIGNVGLQGILQRFFNLDETARYLGIVEIGGFQRQQMVLIYCCGALLPQTAHDSRHQADDIAGLLKVRIIVERANEVLCREVEGIASKRDEGSEPVSRQQSYSGFAATHRPRELVDTTRRAYTCKARERLREQELHPRRQHVRVQELLCFHFSEPGQIGKVDDKVRRPIENGLSRCTGLACLHTMTVSVGDFTKALGLWHPFGNIPWTFKHEAVRLLREVSDS